MVPGRTHREFRLSGERRGAPAAPGADFCSRGFAGADAAPCRSDPLSESGRPQGDGSPRTAAGVRVHPVPQRATPRRGRHAPARRPVSRGGCGGLHHQARHEGRPLRPGQDLPPGRSGMFRAPVPGRRSDDAGGVPIWGPRGPPGERSSGLRVGLGRAVRADHAADQSHRALGSFLRRRGV